MKDFTDGTSNVVIVGEKFSNRNTSGGAISSQLPAYRGSVWVGKAPDTTSAMTASLLKPGTSSFAVNGNSINAFASRHVGGAHFVFGDGRVRFLSENTDQNTLAALGLMNDGVVVGEY